VRYTLKHRLIGAAVLAAVAVLVLPSFFKEKKDYQVNTQSQIPAPPHVVAEEFKAPQPVPDIEPAPAPDTMFVPSEPVSDIPIAAAPEPVTTSSAAKADASASSAKSLAATTQATSSVPAMPLNQKGLPDAWVVQVGSFNNKEAANKLRDDLQADGQKAYVRTTTSGNSTVSRVYIGPKLDKNQALALKEEMDRRLKVKSMVMRFQP
jgi:DedD protein